MTKIPVKPLFRGAEYTTTVWVSDEVADLIVEFLEQDKKAAQKWLDKAQYYAKAGFHRHEGDNQGIRFKWDGVFAIQPWATLFRLYGFYEDATKRNFIIVSTTMKKGQKMRESDKNEVDFAATILSQEAWIKVIPDDE